MRKIFPGYYRPTDDEFLELWQNGLFVLDANVPLNLYAYSSETTKELVNILKEISNRLWIPHQAALEFQRRRLNVIQQQAAAYESIQKSLETSKKKLEQDINTVLRRGKHPFIDIEDLLRQIRDFFPALQNKLNDLKDAHPDFFYDDPIRDDLTNLLKNKVGAPFSQEQLKKIYEKGQERFKQKIPPGYLDIKKNGIEKYGDLVLWFQIIEKAKEIKKPIILVTDDVKDDWWWKFNGKTIGPKPELIQEMSVECDVSFYMYRSDQFMKYARSQLSKAVSREAVDEVTALFEELESGVFSRRIMELIKQKDSKTLKQLIDQARAVDLADAIEHLGPDERLYMFGLLDPN